MKSFDISVGSSYSKYIVIENIETIEFDHGVIMGYTAKITMVSGKKYTVVGKKADELEKIFRSNRHRE